MFAWVKDIALTLDGHVTMDPCLFQKATKRCEINARVFWSKGMMHGKTCLRLKVLHHSYLEGKVTHNHHWRNQGHIELNPKWQEHYLINIWNSLFGDARTKIVKSGEMSLFQNPMHFCITWLLVYNKVKYFAHNKYSFSLGTKPKSFHKMLMVTMCLWIDDDDSDSQL